MTIEDFIKNIATSRQHTCFYHFTDTRNLPSIKKHGLLSMSELTKKKIKIEAPGGNDWSTDADLRAGMDKYAHLTFMTNHGMEYLAKKEQRIIDCKYLQIRPDILLRPGVLMTDDVSNKSGVSARKPTELIKTLDLEVIYTRTDWHDAKIKNRLKAAGKYEILVPESIPLDYIVNING